MKTNTEIFYEFLVKEGVLFLFLTMLHKSGVKSFEEHCKKERHDYVYWFLYGKKEEHTFWNRIHKKWNKYYKSLK